MRCRSSTFLTCSGLPTRCPACRAKEGNFVGDFVGGARQALMMLRSTLALSAEEESLHSRTLMMPRSTLALVLSCLPCGAPHTAHHPIGLL